MVKCPVREAPVVFATARTLMVPDPVTGIAVGVVLLTTNQVASELAVQVQVEVGAVTVMIQLASVAPTVFDTPSSVNELHADPPADCVSASCVAANACPPTLIAPLRAAPVLAATVYDSVPLPVPDALAEPTVSQVSAVDVADQVHDESDAVRLKVPLPPAA